MLTSGQLLFYLTDLPTCRLLQDNNFFYWTELRAYSLLRDDNFFYLTNLQAYHLLRDDNFFYLTDLRASRLCPYNCVKEKSHSHPHDTIILDQQNFVGGNENDSTQFYLKLRRTKRTNY